MPSADEARAAELLERLLTDGEFRASFRRNPADACAAFDLQDLAREFGAGGKSLHTLEIRESRSSLAGALMAAASEGSSAVESLRRMHDGNGFSIDAHRVVHKALTSPRLEAVAAPPLAQDAGLHDHLLPAGGSGGVTQEASASTVSAVLDNPRLTLSPEAHAALVRGGADRRLLEVLETLSREHRLQIGTLQVTHGGGGDSLDILSVDGQRVSQANIAARDLANELASLDPSMRPAQIVTPWPIAGEGFASSGGHDDRIHIVFAAPQSGSSPSALGQAAAAGPPTAAPAAEIDTTVSPGTGSAAEAGAPLAAPPDPVAPPSASGASASDPTTPLLDPSGQPSGGGAARTISPDPGTAPSGDPAPAEPIPSPPDPSTQPSGSGAATTGLPDPGSEPSGGAGPPPEPATPLDPGREPAGGGVPPPEPPPVSPSSPSASPLEQQSGGGAPPPDPTTAADPAAPRAGGQLAESGPDSTPPSPSPPSTPLPSTPPPAATPPTEPGSPLPAPGTLPAGSHQSIQLGAVASTPPGQGTLQFQVPPHELPPGQAGGGGGRELLAESGTGAGAFDPTAAGGLPNASDTYPGDNAGQAAIAAWMARQAHAAGLPAELPIMAALTESGLKNDNYGDRDSLGYFQMRTSIWNQGAYAGYPDHPELQLKWFIDQALAVRSKAIAEGEASFGQDKGTWGNWVAEIEQPAAQYRGRYQTHLAQADGLLGAGGAGAAGTLPGSAPPDPSQFSSALQAGAAQSGYSTAGLQALMIAEKYIGTPYHWGGDTPATGFDCSGLVEYSYAQIGIHIPRVAADQFNVGIPVSKDELRPGDIVFFKDSTGYVHHEGIYIGNDMFLHAPHTGDVVKISSLDDSYYAQQFAGGRDVSGLAAAGSPAATSGPPGSVEPSEPAGSSTPAGGNESGLFGLAAGPGTGGSSSGAAAPVDPLPTAPASPPGSGNTVQFLPAIEDPSE